MDSDDPPRVTLEDLARMTAAGFSDMARRFDETAQRFEGLEQRLDKVEARLDKVEQRLDKVEQRLDKVEARLDKVENLIAETRTDLRELSISIQGMLRRIAQHDEAIASIQSHLHAAQ